VVLLVVLLALAGGLKQLPVLLLQVELHPLLLTIGLAAGAALDAADPFTYDGALC
jgi:hypothetical protein